jgi:amino acid transporter
MNAPTSSTGTGDPFPGRPELTAEASEEQLLYAKILNVGMYLGLGILLATFALYLSGLLAPAVPIEELPNYWNLSAHEYLEAINHQFLHRDELLLGWDWVFVLNRGDFINFLGIAVLALVTIVCYLGILPTLFRKKDWIYGAIAVLEVLILVLAASGLVSAGH